MKNKSKALFLLLLLLILGFCVPAANAELVTINLTATVNYLEESGNCLEGKIHIGSIINGSYIYESTTLDSNPSSTVGDYWHDASPAGISLTVGGFDFKTNPADVQFLMEMINDSTSGGLHDTYLWHSYNNLPLSDVISVADISWQIIDNTATALSSDALPVTTPILKQWQFFNELRMAGGGTEGSYLITASVDSVELVPEPGTFLLLTLGAFAIKRRRHFQN